jgi:hypothetical protein
MLIVLLALCFVSKRFWFFFPSFFQPLDTQEEKSLSLKKKAKKLRARQLKEKRISVSSSSSSAARGGGRSSVVYVGRIPHGFYEEQMRGISCPCTSSSFLFHLFSSIYFP